MTDQLTSALVISAIALLGLLLWALSIALVLRDVNRRSLPGYEQAAWLVLAALLPFIGASAYLFVRLLDRIFSPRAAKNPDPEKRVTAYKPPEKPARRLPTVAAADLYRQTVAELNLPAHTGRVVRRQTSLFLEIIAGPHAGSRFMIENLPARIGRGPLVALSLDGDQGISRQHAEIYAGDKKLRIRDLNSTHGTYLNGDSVSDESLSPGDQLSMGLSTMVFIVEENDDAS